MPEYTFIVNLKEAVGAGLSDTLQKAVSVGETLTVKGWRHKSTGAFNITRIYDSAGNIYSDASPSNALSNDFVADVENGYNGITDLPVPIVLSGGTTIYFDVTDTSAGANTIEIALICVRSTQVQR